jgi:hypothetical protein
MHPSRNVTVPPQLKPPCRTVAPTETSVGAAAVSGPVTDFSDFADAVVALRAAGSTFHLAHGLLDQAEQLQSLGRDEDAQPLITEAEEIAVRLRAEPLRARASSVAGGSTGSASPTEPTALDSLRPAL